MQPEEAAGTASAEGHAERSKAEEQKEQGKDDQGGEDSSQPQWKSILQLTPQCLGISAAQTGWGGN